MKSNKAFSRRAWLGRTAAAAGLPAIAAAREAAAYKPYGPFKMGIQSYSLRGYTLHEALDRTHELGLRFWESYPAHVPFTTDSAKVSEMQATLKDHHVRLGAHGVVRFTADHDANRKIFEGARALGIPVLSADPDPDSFDSLEKLVEEFGIKVGIHNHGPGHRYDKLIDVSRAVQGRHPRIGACVDTGHFLRSKEDPVRVIEDLGPRVVGCHLKDVKDAVHFTILGRGDLNTVGVLKALKALKFKEVLALEYEENPKDPIADIRECLKTVQEAVKQI